MSRDPAAFENSAALGVDHHRSCFACRPRDAGGLGLRFRALEAGVVEAEFDCDSYYQSYPDRVHGGIVALLLDAAMTHCLFTRDVRGYTAKMSLRYRHAVELGVPAVARAWLVEARRPLFVLRAELMQTQVVRARADATFCGAPERDASLLSASRASSDTIPVR